MIVQPPRAVDSSQVQDFHGMIGETKVMTDLFHRIERLAPIPLPLLIFGETGTGKEMVAHAVHEITGPGRPFVAVNCAALTESLAESELFGHVRGAFTGAHRNAPGLMTLADGGILFLDEVAELTSALQAKLLRAIETGRFRPVGATKLRTSSFRLLAATNRPLADLVNDGTFRRDLMHRIGAATLTLPALRERRADIPRLARHFALGVGADGIRDEARELLERGRWDGNVRQLRHVVSLSGALASSGWIEAEHLPKELQRDGTASRTQPSLKAAAKSARARLAREAIRECGGSRKDAALQLGVSLSTLYRLVPARAVGG